MGFSEGVHGGWLGESSKESSRRFTTVDLICTVRGAVLSLVLWLSASFVSSSSSSSLFSLEASTGSDSLSREGSALSAPGGFRAVSRDWNPGNCFVEEEELAAVTVRNRSLRSDSEVRLCIFWWLEGQNSDVAVA